MQIKILEESEGRLVPHSMEEGITVRGRRISCKITS